jgi:hypothetical protein
MAWNAFTADDAMDGLSDAELAAVNNFHGGVEKLPGIVSDMVAAVRGAIAARQLVGAVGTVPDSVRHYVAHLALEHFLLSVPGVTLTEPRKNAANEARKILEQLRDGTLRVELPDSEEFSRQKMHLISANTRQATQDKMKGL